MFVEVTGGENARALTARDTLTITVTDQNDEAPGKPATPTIAEATFNSLKIEWTAPTNTGPDISGYDVRYILTSADENVDANWTEVEDAWTSGNGGNLEYTISSLDQNTSYDVQVRAENDEGISGWSDTVAGVTQANVAPVISSTSTISVSENSTADVVTVTAADSDTDDNITGYEITGGADESQFEIVSGTGVLTFKTAPDFERPGDSDTDNAYIVIVEATSGAGDRELTATQTLTVTVTDETEVPGKPAAPTVAEATVNSLKIDWTAPTNTGPDISGYDVRYILTSADETDDANWTEVEDAWTSGNGGNLEYTISSLDQNTSYDVQVRAENDEGTSDWSDTVAGVTVENQGPVFAAVAPITVSENIITAIVTVSATDDDAEDDITGYGIVDAADGSAFSIVEATGVLTFNVAPNYEFPTDVAVTAPASGAGDNEYIVIVEAASGAGDRELTATQTLTVTVSDVETEAPGVPATPTIAEATFNSLKVEWTAPENTGPDISAYDVRYILTSASDTDKADDTKWTEVEDAWTSGSLEYTIGSLDQNTSYNVQVRAENDEGAGAWSDTIAGMTQANVAPVISSASTISVSENSTADVVTVTAADSDTDDNITGYGIVDAADGSAFSIVEATGVLTFKVAPNYEAPTDVVSTAPASRAGDNEYIVIVEATSGTGDRELTATQTLTVTVTDETEVPGTPATPTIAEATFNSLKISWTAPTNTGPSISAYDVRYILTSADETDDTKWTEVEDAWTSGGSLEYTIGELSQNTSYDIQVRAENDEGTSGWSSSVVGTPDANVAPVFSSASMFDVDENSTGDIVTVTATDGDSDDDIEGYSIVDDGDGSQFEINDQTGVLTFKVAPNYEAPTDVVSTAPASGAGDNEYIVIVEATSGTGDRELTATQTLTVTVTDETEVPGTPAAPTIAEATFNSLKVVWNAPTNTGPAISAYDVRYILSSASETDKADDTKWTEVEDAWTSGDGALEYTISSLAQDTEYDVQILAESAEGTSDWSDTVSGTTSANVAPVITSTSSFTVSENITTATTVGIVSATDADEDDSITGYAIVTGADGAQFSLGASTGVLTFKASPNYEAPTDVAVTDPANAADNNEYIVYVEATGGADSRALTARDTLTITVSDVVEKPGTLATPTIAEATFNSLKVNWTVPTNTGPAISSYDVRYILSSASATDKADDNNWTEVEDAWTSGTLEYTISALDQNTGYDIQVRAESDEGTSDWSDSVSGTTEANVAPVISSASTISVSENSTADIVTVTATDADVDDNIAGYDIVEGADRSQFSIVEATGVLTFKVAPNYEAPTDVEVTDPANAAKNNEYIVVVEATGGAGPRALTSRDTLTITVTDVNEAPGTPATPVLTDATLNSLKVSWTAPTNTGPSITAYDVRYIPTSDDETKDDNWKVEEDVWKSDTGGPLEYTIDDLDHSTSYDVQVRAENAEGTGVWSASVKESTLQDQAPTISTLAFTVAENSTDAVTVTATDADAGDSILGYAIVEGADGAQFSIVDATGVLSFKTPADYEKPKDVAFTDPANSANDNAAKNNEYIVVVTVDGGKDSRVLTTRGTLVVTVTDVNEAPGTPAVPTIAEATFNSLKVQWAEPTNTGPSISAYDVRYILSSASETDKADATKWAVVEDAWTSNNGGSLEYTISSLESNTGYDVQVRAENEEGVGPWSETVVGVPGSDYDVDNNGLIEVSTLEQLDAIRYDLDGDGSTAEAHKEDYALAFPGAVDRMGCPESGCTGYELTTDLDFENAESYASREVNTAWTTGNGWEPIGTSTDPFTATFHGGGHSISNLRVSRSNNWVGLFGISSGMLQNVGLGSVDVRGSGFAGGLVGTNTGVVSATYVTGQVGSSSGYAGGLAGKNEGVIRTSYSWVTVVNTLNGGGFVGQNAGTLSACYAAGTVSTSSDAGGLVGWNLSSGSVQQCYAIGRVLSSASNRVGGFFGFLSTPHSSTTFSASYWDREITGHNNGVGSVAVSVFPASRIAGKPTSELQSPTGYTGIYGTWNDEDVTGMMWQMRFGTLGQRASIPS